MIVYVSLRTMTVPEGGVVRVTRPILEFYAPWNIFGTAKATDSRDISGVWNCRMFTWPWPLL